jgi:hypothetical protein
VNYVCLVYQDAENLAAVPDEKLTAVMAECGAWVQELEASGHHVYSSGLQSANAATTLRYRNEKLSVTDGPFAETKEFLGGFTILSARDLNEAIQLASKLAIACLGTVEIRPVMDLSAEVSDPLDQKLANSWRLAIKHGT